jgi:glycogen operon protein
VPTPSGPHRLGVRPRAGGVDVAVLASRAEQVDFCLLEPSSGDWIEHRTPLPERTHGVWHGFVPGVRPGQRYGLRVHGPWDPDRGFRHNPMKLLLDPYARAVVLPDSLRPEVFAHAVDDDLRGDPWLADLRDSAPHAPHGVVVADDGYDWAGDTPPRTPWRDTVVYEAHVRGLTRRHPGVPDALRGTYAGLGHPATIAHLTRLGVTAIELLPVHAIGTEGRLAAAGRTNYWGYSTLGFFAPHPGYAAATDPLGLLDEFRDMVCSLHAAGLEVILDVVYNHTCEGDVTGPSLSWRGLDAATYYRLDAYGRDIDTTGTGNTLDAREPRVVQMILDSLRYWVEAMHVDGFRFDLATTLARGQDGFDPNHPLLVAIRADPVLAGVKLIAEPWDVGPHGWRTGQFPPPFAEWNDRFRDAVRDFWLTGGRRSERGELGAGVSDLATRLAGSADVFTADRGPTASVNYVTAHDGFTLADATSYDVKHNEANGEGNRDGADDNRSWNHGPEGATDDPDVLAHRRRTARNLLATLMLSAGMPMLLGGDEIGRTQGGNNNAYCLDDDTSWLDWAPAGWKDDLLATVAFLVRLRRERAVLRQDRFFAGRPVRPDGTKDLAWFGPDGAEMDHVRWHDPTQLTLQMYLHNGVGGSLLVIFAGGGQPQDLVLPPRPWAAGFRLLWHSGMERPPDRTAPGAPLLAPGHVLTVESASVHIYAVQSPGIALRA